MPRRRLTLVDRLWLAIFVTIVLYALILCIEGWQRRNPGIIETSGAPRKGAQSPGTAGRFLLLFLLVVAGLVTTTGCRGLHPYHGRPRAMCGQGVPQLVRPHATAPRPHSTPPATQNTQPPPQLYA